MRDREFIGKLDMSMFHQWLNPRMSVNETYAAKRLLSEFCETDEKVYNHFLGVMPPIDYSNGCFMMQERATDNITLAFFPFSDTCPDMRYFATHVRLSEYRLTIDILRYTLPPQQTVFLEYLGLSGST
jgi:hypothetical protein